MQTFTNRLLAMATFCTFTYSMVTSIQWDRRLEFSSYVSILNTHVF